MLNLFRWHTRKCPHDSRESQKCRCPIWIDWTIDGKRIRKSLEMRDWQAALLRARQIETDGLSPNTATITIDKAIQEFETELIKVRRLKEPTMRKYKYLFRKLREFCKHNGLVFLGQLNVGEMRQFRSQWNLGPLTDLKQLERLKAFFKFLVESEWIKASPVRSFKPSKINHENDAVPFTEEEIEKILEVCNDRKLKVLTNVLLESGLRISDAVMIRKNQIVKINGEYSLVIRTEKTHTRVTCPLPNDVAEDFLILDTAHPFWTGNCNAEDCASLWRKRFAALFKQAGIKGHPHQFRHTFAKRMLMAHMPVGTLAILLGHRHVSVTEKHYSRWIPERQASVDAAVRAARTIIRSGIHTAD